MQFNDVLVDELDERQGLQFNDVLVDELDRKVQFNDMPVNELDKVQFNNVPVEQERDNVTKEKRFLILVVTNRNTGPA